MLNLFEKRRPIDIVTLSEILESADQIKVVGGSAYLDGNGGIGSTNTSCG